MHEESIAVCFLTAQEGKEGGFCLLWKKEGLECRLEVRRPAETGPLTESDTVYTPCHDRNLVAVDSAALGEAEFPAFEGVRKRKAFS